MKREIFMCLILSLLFISGCSIKNNETTLDQNSTVSLMSDQSDNVVDEGTHYRIYKKDSVYCFEIYNRKGATVYASESVKSPEFKMISEDVLRISAQAGTGLSTKWNLYYNTSTEQLSNPYYYVLSDDNDKVVYWSVDKLIVQDVFDKNIFYTEIQGFDKELSSCVDPIISCHFINDTQIEIVYLSGSNYEKNIQTINIK